MSTTTTDSICFHINGKPYTVRGDAFCSTYTLNQYLRDEALLKGTKAMCREGGCGICVVSVSTDGKAYMTVNSCIIYLYQCNAWDIWTIEGAGGRGQGYHKVQQLLADNNGSQCGYCSPAMVMSILESTQSENRKKDASKLETYIDGNICRCTGYRPIIKTLYDASKMLDIEELPACAKGKDCCKGACKEKEQTCTMLTSADGVIWLRPANLYQLKSCLKQYKDKKYFLLAGHTGETVFDKDERSEVYIDVNSVEDLKGLKDKDNKDCVVIGANTTLTTLIDTFNEIAAKDMSGPFSYLHDVAEQLRFIGNLHVRNKGTWTGNLMMKRKYHLQFPSDVYTNFEGVGCMLNIWVSNTDVVHTISMREFLKTDMKGKIILSASFAARNGYRMASYKVGPRYQNNLAYVNLTMLAKLDSDLKVIERPYLSIGNLEANLSDIEEYLVDKQLSDSKTIQGAMWVLGKSKQLNGHLDEKAFQGRLILARNLLYKAILKLCGSHVPEDSKSGGEPIRRQQAVLKSADFQTDESKWPMTQYLPKVDSVKQTSGEAEFVGDIPNYAGQLYAVFVKASHGNADIESIDTKRAAECPGVVKIITAKEIPGSNRMPRMLTDDEIFLVEKKVHYHGQPVAIVVAKTEEEAYAARRQVNVKYTNIKKPIVSIDDAIQAGQISKKAMEDCIKGDVKQDFSGKGQQVAEVCGSIQTGEQYHFHMETQVSLAVPSEGKVKIYSATQSAVPLKLAVAGMLGIHSNKVDVEVRRVGGGFGGKISRAGFVCNGASLSAYLTNRPVKMCLNMEDNMEICGKRNPFKIEYKAKVSRNDMKLLSMEIKVYMDYGWNSNESMPGEFHRLFENAYFCPNWDFKLWTVSTNRATQCFTRAPGTSTATMFMEQVMDHLASELSVDPVALREANLYKEGQVTCYGQKLNECFIEKIWYQLKSQSDYEKRKKEVEEFNAKNKWRKKGLAHMPLKYFQNFFAQLQFTVHVMINVDGGNVTIIPGGAEIGQGLNTKTMQVAAATLGIPIEMVDCQPMSATFNHMSSATGGSVASDLNCYAVKKACEKLAERIDPVKAQLPKDAPWYQVVFAAFMQGIELQERYMVRGDDLQEDHHKFVYNIFGSMITEVELDVLAGQYIIQRADLLYDCGECYSPAIDIGQIEGAVAMGLGYYLTEQIKFDTKSGAILNKNTWTYKPPMVMDIPVDMRVSLLKDAPNPAFLLRSKVVGEPPLLLSASALSALRQAIQAFRRQQGDNSYVAFDLPLTVEKIVQLCAADPESFQVTQ